MIAEALLAISAMFLSQVSQPAPLKPNAKWTVSYNEGDCTLSRTFGDAKSPTIFGFKPAPTMANGDIVLIQSGTRPTNSSAGRGAITLLPSGHRLSTRWDAGKLADGSYGVRFWADDPDFWDTLKDAKSVQIEFGSAEPIILEIGEMSKAVEGITTCGVALLRRWGVDPTAPVLPARDIRMRSWFIAKDYPRVALSQGHEGRVQIVLTFDRSGKPINCNVVVSSRSPPLDSGTCAVAMRRARVPAAGAGEADARYLYVPIRWSIGL